MHLGRNLVTGAPGRRHSRPDGHADHPQKEGEQRNQKLIANAPAHGFSRVPYQVAAICYNTARICWRSLASRVPSTLCTRVFATVAILWSRTMEGASKPLFFQWAIGTS